MFRGLEVGENFTSRTEIEQAPPESFLFQSGYLAVRSRKGLNLVLDYPNQEVLSSVAELFLYGKFDLDGFSSEVNNLETALANGDAQTLIRMYDRLLAAIPYDIYTREEAKYAEENRVRPLAESFYHTILFSMIWSSRIRTTAENHSYRGRSDIEAEKNDRHYVIELKAAAGKEAAEKAADEAIRQIREKGYADKYAGKNTTLVGIGVDKDARRVGGVKIEEL